MMPKRSFLKSPFGRAAIICFVVALITPFIFVDSKSSTKKEVTKKVTPTVTIEPSKSEEGDQEVQGQSTYTQVSSPTVTTQPTRSANSGQASQQASQPTATLTPQATATPAKQTFQVALSINGSAVGSVTLEAGANQCDVLLKAKDQGKISQLLMTYNNSLGTYGVYQINGIGKENVVWWVYKVNGQSPSQGCSYVKANSGESVEWEYKGN